MKLFYGKRWTFNSLNTPLFLLQLFAFFFLSTYPTLAFVDGFTLFPCKKTVGNFTVLHHAAVLLRAITLVALPYKFLFLLQIPHILICLSVKGSVLHILFRIPIEIFLKTVSYRQIIPKMSDPVSSVLLSTSYLHTLIVSRLILLLILIILIRLCVCFLLIWSILSLITFWILMLHCYFFDCQQRKLS